jgi:hypothetical protein
MVAFIILLSVLRGPSFLMMVCSLIIFMMGLALESFTDWAGELLVRDDIVVIGHGPKEKFDGVMCRCDRVQHDQSTTC